MSRDQDTVTVRAPARRYAPCSSETMHALPDPADPDQAVLQNVPFFVDGLNFGDVVRLGAPDEIGIRPIERVVVPSGHLHFLILLGSLSASNLIVHLGENFPEYAIRTEGDGDGLLSVSVHPDLEPEEVVYAVFDWLEVQDLPPGDDSVGVTNLFESEIGPLR